MASSSGSSASSGVRSGPPPRANPSTRCRSNCLHNSYQWPVSGFQSGNWKRVTGNSLSLTLTELESLTRSLLAVLFPLFDARIAGQKAGLLEPLPQLDVVFDQRPRDPEAQRACLSGNAAAADGGEHIKLIGRFCHRQRLFDLGAKRFGREGLFDRFPVDDHSARAWPEEHARG